MEKQNREFFAELAGGCDTLLTDVSLGKVHSGDVLAGFDGALSKPIRALKAYEVIPKTDRVLIRMGREGMDYSLIWEPDAGHAGRKHLLIERNGEQKRVYSRYE